MTSLSRLIAAATLISATALAPGLAAADDRHERDRDEDRAAPYAPPARDQERLGRYAPAQDDRLGQAAPCDHDDRYAPAPARAQDRWPAERRVSPAWMTRDDQRWNGRAWVRVGWDRQGQDPRFQQARAVRRELVELERDRAEFHARFAWQPRRLARFDRGYLERRADLERQLQQLTWYASR